MIITIFSNSLVNIALREWRAIWKAQCMYFFGHNTHTEIRLPLYSFAFICSYLNGQNGYVAAASKGQLISEWNFGVFKSPQKLTKFLTDFCPSFIGQKSVYNLIGFWGDFKTLKFHFEINWPLDTLKTPF